MRHHARSIGHRSARRAALALLAGLASGAPALAQPTFLLTRILTDGDFVSGVGTVTSITNAAVNNSGTWLLEADTDNGDTAIDGVILRSGSVFLQENQTLTGLSPGNLSSVDGFNINSAGNTGANYFLRNTGSGSTDSGLFFNDVMIFQEGTISSSPAFTNPTPYIGFFDATMNDSNRLLVIASVDDPLIASTVDRAMVVLDYNATLGTYTESVIYKEGDIPSGQTEAVADFGTGPHTYALNNAGQSVYSIDLTGDTLVDGALYLDTTPLAQEGGPSPETGRTYLTLLGRAIHINDNGDTVYRASLSGDAATNEVVITKPFGGGAAIFAQEGQVLASLAPHALAGFGTGPVYISNTGNVVWAADTNNPDTTADIAVMYNDQVVVKEGQTVGGFTVATVRSVEAGYHMSRSGRFIVIRCVYTDGSDGAISAKVLPGCPADYNLDGFVDGIDYDDFNNEFETPC